MQKIVKYYISFNFDGYGNKANCSDHSIIDVHPFEWIARCRDKYTDGTYTLMWWKELSEDEKLMIDKYELSEHKISGDYQWIT
jgi:hypothetical protein